MKYFTIKNWDDLQHYKDRSPPWIKLHRSLLDDYEFAALPDGTKAALMLIWLLASQNSGRVPDDPKFLMRKLGLEKAPDLAFLASNGFLIPEQDASSTLADDKQSAPLEEKSREEERRGEKFALPDWVSPEAWAGFEEMRLKLKKPMTDRARRLVIKKLSDLRAAGHNPNAILDNSTTNGWQDVYAPRQDGKPVAAAPVEKGTPIGNLTL